MYLQIQETVLPAALAWIALCGLIAMTSLSESLEIPLHTLLMAHLHSIDRNTMRRKHHRHAKLTDASWHTELEEHTKPLWHTA